MKTETLQNQQLTQSQLERAMRRSRDGNGCGKGRVALQKNVNFSVLNNLAFNGRIFLNHKALNFNELFIL